MDLFTLFILPAIKPELLRISSGYLILPCLSAKWRKKNTLVPLSTKVSLPCAVTEHLITTRRSQVHTFLLGEVQEGDVAVVDSRLHFSPFCHIFHKPHLNQEKCNCQLRKLIFLFLFIYAHNIPSTSEFGFLLECRV